MKCSRMFSPGVSSNASGLWLGFGFHVVWFVSGIGARKAGDERAFRYIQRLQRWIFVPMCGAVRFEMYTIGIKTCVLLNFTSASKEQTRNLSKNYPAFNSIMIMAPLASLEAAEPLGDDIRHAFSKLRLLFYDRVSCAGCYDSTCGGYLSLWNIQIDSDTGGRLSSHLSRPHSHSFAKIKSCRALLSRFRPRSQQ